MNISALGRQLPAIYGNVAAGVIPLLTGVIQGSIALMVAGIAWTMSWVSILVLVQLDRRRMAEMTVILTGDVIDPKQAKLPGMQSHMHRTQDLSQVV